MKAIKKQLPVDYFDYKDINFDMIAELAEWMKTFNDDVSDAFAINVVDEKYNIMFTSFDNLTLSTNALIIRGTAGEYYPCDRNLFYNVYELVEETKPELKRECKCENKRLLKDKSYNNTDLNATKKNVSDLQVFGNGDMFKLLSKASSKQEGWMKSTMAMEISGLGCLVQVTTQQNDHVAEALSFVPYATIVEKTNSEGKIIGRAIEITTLPIHV